MLASGRNACRFRVVLCHQEGGYRMSVRVLRWQVLLRYARRICCANRRVWVGAGRDVHRTASKAPVRSGQRFGGRHQALC
jgi:hypothetical protein